jgi:uncharacterized membrane protein YsdA (DUF1294 family)
MTIGQFYLWWIGFWSIVTIILYGIDKAAAKVSTRRVPERVLHFLALIGGFLGGWIGRAVFRHKTRKVIFMIVLSISTILHLAILYFIFLRP